MHHFRKSRPSAPTTPAELVRTLAPQRDLRTLAAAASVIALSTTSAFVDTRDVPSDGPADHVRDTDWRTTHATVRMALDLTKESSDMLLPLKATIGGVSALIRNFEVSMSYM